MNFKFKNYNKIPITFQANEGQIQSNINFAVCNLCYDLFLMPCEALMTFKGITPSCNIRMKLVNGNRNAKAIGLEKLSCKSNYFIGNDEEKWHIGVSNYSSVKYEDIYDGIDMVYYGNENGLECDFISHPGVDANIIALDFEGIEDLKVNDDNDLILYTNYVELCLSKPIAYQEIDGKKSSVSVKYVVHNEHRVSFEIQNYDITKSLIVDPILLWSTYFGGSNDDIATDVAVDSEGNVYITGYTYSSSFYNVTPTYPYAGDVDAFVAKIKSDGSKVIFFTYIGGKSSVSPYFAPFDYSRSIAIDSRKDIYITGSTACKDFPMYKPIQIDNSAYINGFITKIKSDGSELIFSTCLGKGGKDAYNECFGITLDIYDNVYATGYAKNIALPITYGAIKTSISGKVSDAFIIKFTPEGNLSYCSYFGGNNDDCGIAVSIDNNLNVYIMGNTKGDFPIYSDNSSPLQSVYGGGKLDLFLIKIILDSIGNYHYGYSTYLGGSGEDTGKALAVDSIGNVYVTGYTTGDFPLKNPIQSHYGGGNTDAFISKISADGSKYIYSTYLGGTGDDYGMDIQVDSYSNVYVIGETSSSNDFPIKNAIQFTYGGGSKDIFITKIAADGLNIIYSTYVGGIGNESAGGIAVDLNGNIYISGSTDSWDFPIRSPFQLTNMGKSDIFIAKIYEVLQSKLAATRGIDFFK